MVFHKRVNSCQMVCAGGLLPLARPLYRLFVKCACRNPIRALTIPASSRVQNADSLPRSPVTAPLPGRLNPPSFSFPRAHPFRPMAAPPAPACGHMLKRQGAPPSPAPFGNRRATFPRRAADPRASAPARASRCGRRSCGRCPAVWPPRAADSTRRPGCHSAGG